MDTWATLDRYADVVGELSMAEPLAERLGPDWRSLLLLTRASHQMVQGRFHDAMALVDEACELGRDGGEASSLHLVFAFAVARVTSEGITEVLTAVRRAVDGMPFQARGWLCLALLAAGRREEAGELWRALAPHVLHMPEDAPEFLIATIGNAETSSRLGDVVAAAALYDLLLPYDGLHAIAHAYGPYEGPVALAPRQAGLADGPN
jgi:hypothetical protein